MPHMKNKGSQVKMEVKDFITDTWHKRIKEENLASPLHPEKLEMKANPKEWNVMAKALYTNPLNLMMVN